ncbi:glycoside hydrolase family 16 protein [Apiospora saccharicola]|uniref:Glycoside hydrolase family 16 protein n=1 Tax=Apiospora saccharicola TaxID=335842 RepID=A0ABR1UDM6_9PEZI
MWSNTLLALAPLVASSAAWAPPSYSGFNLRWNDAFGGNSGTSPNTGNWNIITGDLNVNNELETYSSSTRNLQVSGGNTLQIVPWKGGGTHGWTSGRIESKYTFTPAAGVVTRVEAIIKFGSNPTSTKQGLWPAFWMLGNSIRNGVQWPGCGELDIMETVNGALTGYGTVHCDKAPGGICKETNGLGANIGIPNQDFHTWRLEWDLTSSNWQSQSIKWSMDGQVYHTLTGNNIGNQAVWKTLAGSPMFFILNMAVGGGWPGNPNGATQDGYGAMMEVGYVAHYQRTNRALTGQDPYSASNVTDYPNTDDAVAPEMTTLMDKEAPFLSKKTLARMAQLFRA